MAAEKEFFLQAWRTQMADLDFGTLDPEFVDGIEPYLELDPDVESGIYSSAE